MGDGRGVWEGVRRSLICPPWNVLLTVDPLERQDEGVDDEEETPEAPAMLWVEGEAGGRRCDKVLNGERKNRQLGSGVTRTTPWHRTKSLHQLFINISVF